MLPCNRICRSQSKTAQYPKSLKCGGPLILQSEVCEHGCTCATPRMMCLPQHQNFKNDMSTPTLAFTSGFVSGGARDWTQDLECHKQELYTPNLLPGFWRNLIHSKRKQFSTKSTFLWFLLMPKSTLCLELHKNNQPVSPPCAGFVFFFETGYYYVVQTSFGPLIPPSLSPGCLDYKCILPCLAYVDMHTHIFIYTYICIHTHGGTCCQHSEYKSRRSMSSWSA